MLADAGKLKLKYGWMFGQLMALSHIRWFSQNTAVEGKFSVLIIWKLIVVVFYNKTILLKATFIVFCLFVSFI